MAEAGKMPLVSVGIPSYARPEGLRHVLGCVLSQSFDNIEIIVSDNGTRGEAGRQVAEIMNDFMHRDFRISFYQQEKNMGAAHNFKFVLEKARGKYFMWAADDDSYSPIFIERLLTTFNSCSSSCIAVGAEAQYTSGDCLHDKFFEGRNWHIEQDCKYIERMIHTMYNSYGNMFYSIYKTEVIKQKKVIDAFDSKIGNEIPFLLAVSRHGSRVILKDFLFTKKASCPAIKFAYWQAGGGYYGLKEHIKNLWSFFSTKHYMSILGDEIENVLEEFKSDNLLSDTDVELLMQHFIKMKNIFLRQWLTAYRARRI